LFMAHDDLRPQAIGRIDPTHDVPLSSFCEADDVACLNITSATYCPVDCQVDASSGQMPPPKPHSIVLGCFLLTCGLYIDRVGFPLAYTHAAKSVGLDELHKSAALSAFYYGYAGAQIPGGAAAARIGGFHILFIACVVWSSSSLIMPFTLETVTLTCIVRMITGLVQGLVIPAVHTILAQEIHPNQKSRAVSFAVSGMYMGSTLAMMALPSALEYFGPAHILGSLALLPMVCFLCLWTTSGARKAGSNVAMDAMRLEQGQQKVGKPWAMIFTSLPVWCIVANSFTFHYALYTIMNWLPTYFDELIRRPLSSLGYMKIMPYLMMFISSNAAGVLGDHLVQKDFGIAHTRKLINSLGFFGACLALPCIALVPEGNVSAAGVMLSISLAMLGFARGGFSINHMDIAPDHAGLVIGLVNTAGTVAGVLGVTTTGALLKLYGGAGERYGWIIAMSLASLLCACGAVFFAWSARGHRLFG